MNRTLRLILAIFFIMVITVSGVQISQYLLRTARLDVTEENLYTLSEGTKNILGSLKQPITLRLYYTKTAAMKAPDQIRFYNMYYDFVRALLDEYVLNSGGMVKLEEIDPRPYSQEELSAIRQGLRRFNITEEESFFFGLVLQTQFGVTKTIPFFSPDRQSFVEYDITYLIDSAITRAKKRIGVLTPLSMMGEDISVYMRTMRQMQGQRSIPAWGIIRQLQESYEVKSLLLETEEIKDIDLLLVIHPKDLPEKTRFAIDQYVLRGGRVIAAVDPHCISDRPETGMQFNPSHLTASNMPDLLAAWGLEMPPMTFSGDLDLAVVGSLAPNQRPEKILPFLALTKSQNCFDDKSVITGDLNEVSLWFAGVLKPITSENLPEDISYTPLLRTTPKGNTWTVSANHELMMPNYPGFLEKFRPGTSSQVLAYRVTGTFKSAFPDGIDVTEETEDDEVAEKQDASEPKTRHLTGLTEAAEPVSVVVVADVDFLSDLVAYRDTIFGLAAVGDNSAFVQNSLEALSGSTNLISVRSKGGYKRPFVKVEQIEAEAEAQTAEEESRITAQIRGFEQQLNEKLASLENKEQELINKTILKEKKDIEVQLHEAEIRLREVKNEKVIAKEQLKARLRNFSTLPGPLLTLAIAVVLSIRRSVMRRYYIYHTREPDSGV